MFQVSWKNLNGKTRILGGKTSEIHPHGMNALINLTHLKNGEQSAWTLAYPVFWGVALSAAGRAHPNLTPEDCEDVAIKSITALMDMIAGIQEERELRPLLATIAHHQAISLARKKLGLKRGGDNVQSLDAVLEEHGDGAMVDGELDPAWLLQQAQLATLLRTALDQVKEQHRKILADRYFEGLDYRELAAKHQLSENSIGVYLKRGLEELRQILGQDANTMKEIQEALR